jgi:ATP-dependent RNA helicase DDX19/DBP5
MSELVDQVKSINLNDGTRQQHIEGHLKGTLNFDELEDTRGQGKKIPQDILNSLLGGKLNFKKPSSIQENSIPRILSGFDLIAQAQPGAGKTVAFAIGILLKVDANVNATQAICLTPTRELAVQIAIDALQRLMCEYPSSSKKPTIRLALREDPESKGKSAQIAGHLQHLIIPKVRGEKCTSQIIVGTPGTVSNWAGCKDDGSCKQKIKEYLSLSEVKILVIDEADSMIGDGSRGSDGLVEQTGLIKKYVDANSMYKCQYLFFSATFTDAVIAFGRKLLDGKVSVIKLNTKEALVLSAIKQYRLDVGQTGVSNCEDGFDLKLEVLKLIYDINLKKTIIFCKTVVQANLIARALREQKLLCSVLHGKNTGEERDMVMEAFREDPQLKVLITTNVLARGVDVPAVSAVINFSIPELFVGHTNTNIADHEGCELSFYYFIFIH